MRIFLTDATGFIGSAIIPELISAGHQVLGLTRSDAGAKALAAARAEVHRGDLEDLESLRRGAAMSYLIAVAREKGISAYIGDGLNRWPAVHRFDCVRLYKLALEKGSAGARYHAVAEEGVPVREIAEAIGRGLKVPTVSKSPEEAGEHFGWLAAFVGFDMLASSALTQKRVGWRPTGPGLISDLDHMQYFKA